MCVPQYKINAHIFLVLFLCVLYVFGYAYDDEEITDPMQYVKDDGVYYSLNSILDFFHKDEDMALFYFIHNSVNEIVLWFVGAPFATISYDLFMNHFRESIGIKELLQRYQDSIKRWEERANSGKPQKLFIAVEGINPHNRKVAAQLLTQKVGGRFLVNPARTGLGPILDEQKARKAYYALSKYATSNYVRLISLYQPVVMQRYWFDHATFIMAKRFTDKNLPPPNSTIYQFPEDLLKPNMTFFINDANFDRMSKNQGDFARRLIKIYRNIREPPVTEIECKGPPRLIVQKMMEFVNEFGQ